MMKFFPDQQHERGFLPIVLMLAGAGVAVLTAQLSRLDRELDSTAEKRRLLAADQINRSAVAVLKQLMNSGPSTLPAVFPDPYIQPVTPPQAFGFGSSVVGLPSVHGWSLKPVSGSSEKLLSVLVPDAAKIDFSSILNGPPSTGTAQEADIRIKAVNLTPTSKSWAPIESVEVAVETEHPSKANRKIVAQFLMAVPPPMPPTCRLDIDATTARLLVTGVVTDATITGDLRPDQVASYNRGAVAAGDVTADSIFGVDRQILDLGLSGTTGLSVFEARISGPGGDSSCRGTSGFDESTIRLGINFEDIPDGGDLDFNDAVMCFEGKFRYSSEAVVSAEDQTLDIDVYSISGCEHTMTLVIKDSNGIPDPSRKRTFSSRAVSVPSVTLLKGDQLFVSMAVGGECSEYTRNMGDKFSGWTNRDSYVAVIEKDVCRTTGK